MATILPFDELNAFKLKLLERFPDGKLVAEDDHEDILDWMLDIFLLAYANGVNQTNQSLSTNWIPPIDAVMDTVDKKVAGKTWKQRVEEYFANGGSVDDLVRIAETEAHRDSNEGAFTVAAKVGAKTKTWVCMMLPTSRDTHIYLNGTTVPIDAEFYTFMGNKAQFPGQFGVAEEDVNCMCQLSYGK